MNCWFTRRVNKWIFLVHFCVFPLLLYLPKSHCRTTHTPELSLPPLNAGKSILLTVFHGTCICLPCSPVVCVPVWSPLLALQKSELATASIFLGLLSLLTMACGPRFDEFMDGRELSDVVFFILWPSIALRIQNGTFQFPHFSPIG